MNYYLVNLTDTYKHVIENKYLFVNKQGGRNIFHWDNILRVQKDDMIFCNIDGYIKAICIAKDICYDDQIEDNNSYIKDIRKLDVDYYELDNGVHINDIAKELLYLQRKKYGAFCKSKNDEYKANAGYLYELSFGQAEYILTFINRDLLPNDFNNKLEI